MKDRTYQRNDPRQIEVVLIVLIVLIVPIVLIVLIVLVVLIVLIVFILLITFIVLMKKELRRTGTMEEVSAAEKK